MALAAFVFGLFAPALSHAFTQEQAPMQAAEICTAMGMVMLPMVDGTDGADGDGGAMPRLAGMPHCDVCCSHHAPPLLSALPDLSLPVVDAGRLYPPLFYQSPSPQFAWTPAQSRAPPAGRS